MAAPHTVDSDYGVGRMLLTASLFSLSGAFTIALFLSATDKGSIAFCALGLAVLAVFWPLVSKIDNLKIGPTGVELTKKVDEAAAKADMAKEKVEDVLEILRRFVFNSMPQPSFDNLRKIADGKFGKYHMTEGFRQQLRNLRDSGYILTNSIAIAAIPEKDDDLSNYVYATELGREFISQRLAAEKLAKKARIE